MSNDETMTRRALAIDPMMASGNNNLAKLQAGRGEAKQASARLRRALLAGPGHQEARRNLGGCCINRTSRRRRGNSWRRLSLGMALGERNDVEGAIAQFREALHLAPGHADANRNLQAALEMQGSVPRPGHSQVMIT